MNVFVSYWFMRLLQQRKFEWEEFFPVGIYLRKVTIRNTRRMREICSKLTIETREQRHSHLIPLETTKKPKLFWCFEEV